MDRVVGRPDPEVVREAGRQTLRNAVQDVARETIEQRRARQQETLMRARWLNEWARANGAKK